jgi:hypothetical protein
MDLATLDGQNVLLATVHRCQRRMNPIEPVRANNPSPCVGLARKVSQKDRAVLLEEDVRWERGYHTRCEPCLLGLAMEAKILRSEAVRTACGGIVESAPEAAPRSPLPASEKVTRTSRYFRVG